MSLMPMKVREVIRLLEKHGWVEMRTRGGHRHFKHPNQAFVTTAPGNEGKEPTDASYHVVVTAGSEREEFEGLTLKKGRTNIATKVNAGSKLIKLEETLSG